jgi:TonB family protein
MKPSIVFLIAFQLLLPLNQGFAQEWKEYSSSHGKFSILLPGEPTTGYRPITQDSPDSVTYVVNLQTSTVAYSISYFDIRRPLTTSMDTRQLFDETTRRSIRMNPMKVLSQEDLIWMTFPARSLKLKTDTGRIVLRRMILVKQRLYRLDVALLGNQKESADAENYFRSFKPTPLTDEEIANLVSFSPTENEKAATRRIRISEALLRQDAIKKVNPNYPNEAKSAGITGSVQVQVLISKDGTVIEAIVISGPEQLREAAIQAAKQWIFKPVTLSGFYVQVAGVLTFEFKKK